MMLATAIMLATSASTSGAAEPVDLFEGGRYVWECRESIERDASSLTGTWTVERDQITNPGLVQWHDKSPILISDGKTQRVLSLWAQWREFAQADAFARGSINFSLKSEKQLPQILIMSFGGSMFDGDFVTRMTAYDPKWGQASVNVGKLMRWAGNNEQLTVSIHMSAKESILGSWLGSGNLSMKSYHQLERDFTDLQARLKAKAANFQRDCEKIEYPSTAEIEIAG